MARYRLAVRRTQKQVDEEAKAAKAAAAPKPRKPRKPKKAADNG